MLKKRLLIELIVGVIILLLQSQYIVASAAEDIIPKETENSSIIQETRLYNSIVTANSLKVHLEPSITSTAIALLAKGTPIKVIEKIETKDISDQNWAKISLDDDTTIAYVSEQYISSLEFGNFPETIDIDEWEIISQSYTSSYNSASNRNYNMELASNTLTGTIILPNETFSWLEIMGNCSEENGYLEAPVYANGNLVTGFGGGVCQVSTTINIAIKNLGISTNAQSHSGRVSYADIEDEATVSYPYVDFSFKNTLDKSILLELISTSGTVLCNVYSQKQ